MSSYQIDTRKKYDDSYKKSVNNPENFWDELASQNFIWNKNCLLYTSPSPRDTEVSRMPSSA